MERAWVGIDIGKHHHHAVVIDHDGTRLMYPGFRRVGLLDFRPRGGWVTASSRTRSVSAYQGRNDGAADCGRSPGTRRSRSPARSGFSIFTGSIARFAFCPRMIR
ncbi:MAG: hypothetical protein JWN03_1068 [Nocardia sp.]|nr:hypothetical protein [Nocardia sp.]